jgi:hypothetical protein
MGLKRSKDFVCKCHAKGKKKHEVELAEIVDSFQEAEIEGM